MQRRQKKFDELTKTAANDDKIKKVAEDRWYQCKFCINKYKKEVTLNKHIHTKHPDGSYRCDKCGKTCLDKDKLESHTNLNHKDGQENHVGSLPENADSIADVKECSLCEDRFLTTKEFQLHVAVHLAEIKELDASEYIFKMVSPKRVKYFPV